jgi:tyrosine-protein kinase Etk/Wzc
MEKREFDIFELIKIIARNRKLIILIVLVVSLGAVAYSLLTPEIWSSGASFFAIGSSSSALSLDIPGFSGLANGLMGLENQADALNFITIMESRTFKEEVIRKFNLISYFRLDNEDPIVNLDNALRKMKKIIIIDLEETTELVAIVVETKNKKLSKDIVDFYLQHIDEYNRLQKITKGKRNREFLEKRVAELRINIDSLLIANRNFQEKYKAIDLEGQSLALITSYSDAVAEKMKADMALDLALINYSSDSPIVKQLRVQRDALAKQIKNMESDKSGLKPQYMIDIEGIPNMAVQMAQLKMNLGIAQKVMEYVYPQYEAAKLEELRDMPTIELVDSAREAGIRVKPKRAIICLISAFAAFWFAIIIVILKEIIKNNQKRISEIREALHS